MIGMGMWNANVVWDSGAKTWCGENAFSGLLLHFWGYAGRRHMGCPSEQRPCTDATPSPHRLWCLLFSRYCCGQEVAGDAEGRVGATQPLFKSM